MSRLTILPFIALALFTGDAWARSLQQVLNQGTLRVGVAISTPWAHRTEAGELAGFEIDVANRLAEDMGVRADILVYAWDRLIPALESGEIDIIAAGLAISPERALHVNFSNPYAEGGITIATHIASTTGLQRLEDLDTDDYRLAAVEGSVAVGLARRVLPRAELVLFNNVDAASAALVSGDVDVYMEELPVPTFLALENPSRVDVPISRPLLNTPAGFAVTKGDSDFLAFLNAWIVARQADTWLPATHGYWFESLGWRRQLEAVPIR